MKDFSKYVLATIVGIIATGILFTVLSLMSIVGMVASTEATKSVEDNSVLVLSLNGVISEQVQADFFSQLTGGEVAQLGLNDILSAIEKAKDNDDIKGIYIEAGMLSAGVSTLQEIRNALADFKKADKWIIAYGDNYTQGAYYLASVADKIYLNPSGSVDIHGMAAQTMFVKDFFAKLGIRYQIIKVGKYKSATEMYSEDHMSDANREQMNAYITGIWSNIRQAIADGRKLSADSIDSYADQFTQMMAQEELVEKDLVDSLVYSNEVKVIVKNKLGIKEGDAIEQLSVADMRTVKEKKQDGEEIAVYYASGNIVDTPAAGIMNMGTSQIVGNTMSKDLEKLMDDEDIKAVVIRVNSPGGSAYASEQIWHRVAMLKEKKPVVISMGDYAASGGYYISCCANWIVAQPTTLTGSIGIFGVIPEASELMKDKLQLHFDGVKTNKHADFGMGMMGFPINAFTEEESALLQKYINRGYELFRKRVADGRNQKTEQIEEIAQGRVWTGEDALKIKLVDQLGGLDDAIVKAAQLAKLEEYYTAEYPAPADWTEQLLTPATGSDNYLNEQMRMLLGDWFMPFATAQALKNQSPVQAAMPYIINIK